MTERDREILEKLGFNPDLKCDKLLWEGIPKGTLQRKDVSNLLAHGYIVKLSEDNYDIPLTALWYLYHTYPDHYLKTQKALREEPTFA